MIAVFCMLDLLLFYGAPCALQFVRNQDQLGVSKGLSTRLRRAQRCASALPVRFFFEKAVSKRTEGLG